MLVLSPNYSKLLWTGGIEQKIAADEDKRFCYVRELMYACKSMGMHEQGLVVENSQMHFSKRETL